MYVWLLKAIHRRRTATLQNIQRQNMINNKRIIIATEAVMLPLTKYTNYGVFLENSLEKSYNTGR